MATLKDLFNKIESLASPEKALLATRFFKTGEGGYSYGDRFLGIPAPIARKLASEFNHLTLQEVDELLVSGYNEVRQIALCILISQFRMGEQQTREAIYSYYLSKTKHINNWNLVDISAKEIVGGFLINKDRNILLGLCMSEDLWERRIAIVATHAFIKQNDYAWTIKLSTELMRDNHDLIHKAVGWMLREVGKRDQAVLIQFLNENAAYMPRVMLRYAIERFPADFRKEFLQLKP